MLVEWMIEEMNEHMVFLKVVIWTLIGFNQITKTVRREEMRNILFPRRVIGSRWRCLIPSFSLLPRLAGRTHFHWPSSPMPCKGKGTEFKVKAGDRSITHLWLLKGLFRLLSESFWHDPISLWQLPCLLTWKAVLGSSSSILAADLKSSISPRVLAPCSRTWYSGAETFN